MQLLFAKRSLQLCGWKSDSAEYNGRLCQLFSDSFLIGQMHILYVEEQ